MEDEAMMAIDKPAGVAVHGGSGVSFGVIEQLRRARPASTNLELVHRLDRETSGVLLVAKKRSALKHLQDQFRDRETGKTYLALVLGLWPSNKKVIDSPLFKYTVETGVGEGERRVKVVDKDDPNGMRSITLVRVARTVGPYTLLEVTIKTGRTHQIRVHLASQGHPIAGDDKYGDFELNKNLQKQPAGHALKRMFLHAWRLKFTHPSNGKRITLLAELPTDGVNAPPALIPPIVPPAVDAPAAVLAPVAAAPVAPVAAVVPAAAGNIAPAVAPSNPPVNILFRTSPSFVIALYRPPTPAPIMAVPRTALPKPTAVAVATNAILFSFQRRLGIIYKHVF
jgi:23S rRNA pseudouridine955/2504/2580 synthase